MKIIPLSLIVCLFFINTAMADCKDPILREKVSETAKTEGVNEKELLSIIAHESGCRYLTIAWNLPGRAQTAKSKFFDTLSEAKSFAENLISTKLYRVDVGIGQINNEAHIQPKKWSLDEVLNPKTALNHVAQVLKERSWKNYHSSNPLLAQKWRRLALFALSKIDSEPSIKTTSKKSPYIERKSSIRLVSGPLLVYNTSSLGSSDNKQNSSWVITKNP